MAITSETSFIEYEGNDSDSTAYVVPFLFFSNAHLKVTVTDADNVATVLALTTDYSATGANDPTGGDVTTVVAYDDTHTIRIERVVPVTNPFVYEEGGRLPMKTLEKNFDTIAMQVQQVQRSTSGLPTEADVDQKIVNAQLNGPTADSVLALLEGEEVIFESVTLPRTGGLVKPLDTLTLDATGRLVVNDNNRPGGRLVANDRRFRGMHVADISDIVYDKVVTIPLTAAECAVNATYQLIGNVRMLMAGTPAEVGFGLLDSATDVAAAGFPNVTGLYGTTTDAAKTEYYINITLKNVAGVLVAATFPESGAFWRKVYTGSDVAASTFSPSDPAAAFPSSAQNIYLHIASFGGGVGSVIFDYDLELIVTKP